MMHNLLIAGKILKKLCTNDHHCNIMGRVQQPKGQGHTVKKEAMKTKAQHGRS